MSHTKRTLDIRKPYSGLSRSLVIAIDVGTTFSGVSYAILEPGEIPKIHGVTRFPGQEHVAGNSKIPSIIYYDKYGKVMAAGAEAENTSVQAQAEDELWIKAELFKLRLRPRTMQLNMNGMRLSPLPKRKTPTHVFGDFLSYLYRCTRSFIIDTHANGQSLFTSIEHDIQFVLSHPNGWEGPQQTRMRAAAVYGGLVPDTDKGRSRIWFVTEGEASLHACVLSGLASEVLQNPSKHGFLVADAGGGTLDISAYAVKGTSPLTIEEIAPPDCIFAGSVFVSRRARDFLEEKLKNSKYGTPDSLDHITRKFDETTKRLFRDRNELQFILFGSPLDKDPAVGIRSGQLRLTGNEVANLFEPSVDAAVNAIKRQVEASNGLIKSVFLVGGYAASPWLFQQLQERLRPNSITVSRPDTQTSKAVADGAIGFYCDHHVSARMSKFMYGVEFLREMDPSDPDHMSRKERLCELPSGPKLLPDAFDCILSRGVKVKESTVFTRKYSTELTNLSLLSVFEVEVWCFRGGNDVPKWINRHDEKFSTLCVVQADLSLLSGSAEPKFGSNGKKYWTIVFSVEIHFGLTEFKARMKWMDNGQVKYGPAVIVYNERGHRIEDEDEMYPEDDTHSNQYSKRSVGTADTPPDSRPRTPVNPYYPANPITASGSEHRTSTLSTSSASNHSKSYSPSIAPSISSRSVSGHQTGTPVQSDSESRRRGKERNGSAHDENSHRSSVYSTSTVTPTPSAIDRTRSGGAGSVHSVHAPSMSRRESAAGGGGAGGSIYSPSVKYPQSRSGSIYGGEAGGEHPASAGSPASQAWGGGGTPKSGDEQRQSHLWGDNHSYVSPSMHHRSPGSVHESMLDRPGHSPYIGGAGDSHHRSSLAPSQGMYDYADRPKSAFGDVPPPPLTFGDGGPAAQTGVGSEGGGLFGNPPASVFGQTASPVNGGGGAEINDAHTPVDEWGFGSSPATPASVKSGKRGKKKTPSPAVGTPVSVSGGGLGSGMNSPGGGHLGTSSSKAPSPYDKGKPLSPLNPASQINEESGGDTWGFPASNANADEWGFEGNNNGGGDEAGNNNNEPSAWGDVNLGEPAREPSRVPSPAPPPAVEVSAAEEPEVSGVKKKKKKAGTAAAKREEEERKRKEDEEKQRLKFEAEERERQIQAEIEAEEARDLDNRLKEAEAEKLRLEAEAAENRRQEEEQRQYEEAERLAYEEQERSEKEEEKRKKEAAEAEAKASRRTSLFGGTSSFLSGAMDTVSTGFGNLDSKWGLSSDTGKGDDSWGISGFGGAGKKKKNGGETEPSAFSNDTGKGDDSWGISGFGGAGKKKKNGGETEPSAFSNDTGKGDDSWGISSFGGAGKKKKNGGETGISQPSAFGGGGGSSWGLSFGENSGAADPPVESHKSPLEFSSNGADSLFNFDSSEKLDFGFGGGERTSREPSPNRSANRSPNKTPAADDLGDLVEEPLNFNASTQPIPSRDRTPLVGTKGLEGEDGAGEGTATGAVEAIEAVAATDDDFDYGGKKKKPKKGKKGGDTGAEDASTPIAETNAAAGGGEEELSAPVVAGGKKKKKKK